MRQWIPLDVRNVDNPIALRNQLRRLNEYMSDLAASLASPDLVPQQPDSTTIFNNLLQQITIAGSDPKNLPFFDDMIADPLSDPFAGASGTWRLGSSGAGSQLVIDTGNTDLTAFGVWIFQTGTAVGADHMAISPTNDTEFPLTLVPGTEIGARLRIDTSAFTRGQVSFGFTDADLSGSNSQQGTKRLAFVIRVADNDYFTSAGLGSDIAIFEAADAAGGSNYIFLDSGRAGSLYTDFANIKMVVTSEQTVACYVNGALVGTLSGTHVPASTVKLALRLRMQTVGVVNPGANQKSYFDRIYIDTSRIDRGAN